MSNEDPGTVTDPVGKMFALYAAKRFDDLSEHLLGHLDALAGRVIFDPEPATLRRHVEWLYAFLSIFVRQDYAVSRRHALRFIRHNATISNLAAASDLYNTDAHLKLFGDNPRQLGKFLALCSARNTAQLDYDLLFDRAPVLSNAWYSAYFAVFQAAMCDRVAWDNLRNHVGQAARPGFAERLVTFARANGLFYGCSYVDEVRDRPLKERINAVVRGSPVVRAARIRNRPDPRHVAVVSMFWRANHSVYRNFSRYVSALADRYRLTLVRRPPAEGTTPDYEDVFDRVIDLDIKHPEPVLDNDFAAVFFPDVGMSLDSLVLSNMRIAPVQVAGVGHSVSGFGNCVDYFISGVDTEIPDAPERHYSERLVLVPGFGVIHNTPRYAPTGAQPTGNRLVINCSWTAQKLNHPLVRALERIVAGARFEILFQFFPGHALRRHAGYLSFARQLRGALGKDNVDISRPLAYPEYMAAIERSDFAIDAFHYGGCNTVADCLHLGKPIVTWQGERWNNRIGSAMLRSAGLSDLVARDADEYVCKVLELVNDEAARADAARRVAAADLAGTVFSSDAAPWFARAFDYLLANHEALSREASRQPVVVSERS